LITVEKLFNKEPVKQDHQVEVNLDKEEGNKVLPPKMWWRGDKANIIDGWNMDKPDALAFICLEDCLVVGFGVLGPVDASVKAGWQLQVRCIVDGKEENSFTFTSNANNKDSESKSYKCIFIAHGGKPLKLSKN
jgi:hypothetical protein